MPDHELILGQRNDPLGLATRSWINLEVIERSFAVEGEGHVITQVLQSVLTIVIFPKEKELLESLQSWSMKEFHEFGGFTPRQLIGETPNVGQLLRHMRNAICHGLVIFHGQGEQGADSRLLSEISIQFDDRLNEHSPIYWSMIIEGPDLKRFLRFIMDVITD